MAGFYGKIPSKGDFLSRGLSRDIISVLDDWFQTGMIESKTALGEQWQGFYQVAPIWQFYLSPGILGDNAWFGVWIASVDRVNRSFPMTLLAHNETSIATVGEFRQFDRWLTDCEDLLLDALEPDLDFDDFCLAVERQTPKQISTEQTKIDQAFETIPLPEQTTDKAPEQSPFEQRLSAVESALEKISEHLNIDIGFKTPKPANVTPATDCNTFGFGVNLAKATFDVNRHSLSAGDGPFSVWLSQGNDVIGEQLIVTKALPDKTDFAKFLTGFDVNE